MASDEAGGIESPGISEGQGDKVDLGELMDEAVPRYPVTSKMEFDWNDDASCHRRTRKKLNRKSYR